MKSKQSLDDVLGEASLLSSVLFINYIKQLNNPHIVKFYGFYEDDENYYVITELMEGGELFDQIIKREYYSESDAKEIITIILEALYYLHSNNIIHRDIKPENVLLKEKNNEKSLKISDFGFAIKINTNEKIKEKCGTPEYVAPEVIEGNEYSYSCDMWSFGVICYILLCGYPPFSNKDDKELFNQIKNGLYEFESPFWDNISDNAKLFIKSLLTVDPNKRLTSEMV